MKKTVLIFLMLIFVLTACNSPEAEDVTLDSSKLPVNNPTGNVLYVANTSSKTYHLTSCYIAESISSENRLETKDMDFLRSRQYTSCKICIGKPN